MASNAQFLSGGRFILGIGAGWKEDEYRAYGYDFPPAGTRAEELAEGLQPITAMRRNEPATVHGKHNQVAEARSEPRPARLPRITVGPLNPRTPVLPTSATNVG